MVGHGDRRKWRWSPVADDWVVKGFHIKYGDIEILMRPDHLGGVVFKKFFKEDPDDLVEAVIRRAHEELLTDPKHLRKMLEVIHQAQEFLLGQRGKLQGRACGLLREFRFLEIAILRRLGGSDEPA